VFASPPAIVAYRLLFTNALRCCNDQFSHIVLGRDKPIRRFQVRERQFVSRWLYLPDSTVRRLFTEAYLGRCRCLNYL